MGHSQQHGGGGGGVFNVLGAEKEKSLMTKQLH